MREFETLIRERTRNFIGRDFLFNAIEEIIKDKDFPSGYIIISGEPGIGKTSFMAELVKRTGYVHHFNISLQGIRSVKDFLQNVTAQLIIRYNLDYSSLPPQAFKDSGFLSQLLSDATQKIKDQPLLILIDALDEVEDIGLSQEANRLYLPPSLPDGAFFVITTREKHDYRLFVDRRKDIYLRDDDPQNLKDIASYIQNFMNSHQDAMLKRIDEWGINKDEFIKVIAEKSEGNFAYLVYVMRDIIDGKLSAKNVDDIRNLPKGLFAYYQRHWNIMKAQDKDKFDKYYKPVVCILATAREPVSIDQLSEWTTLPYADIQQVINDWREFLNIDDKAPDVTLYRIYHASFRDFLEKAEGLKQYHSRIAQIGLDKIFGGGSHA